MTNHTAEPRALRLRLAVDADCADLFEVTDLRATPGTRSRSVDGTTLRLDYQRGNYARETRVDSSQPPDFDAESLSWSIQVPAHGEWITRLTVAATEVIQNGVRPDAEAAQGPQGADHRGGGAGIVARQLEQSFGRRPHDSRIE